MTDENEDAFAKRIRESGRLACRLCIARRGLKATDIGKLPKTEQEFYQHLRDAHGIVVQPTDMRPLHVAEASLSQEEMEATGIQFYDGYPTPFTRKQAPGAMRSGTRVVKVYIEEGDTRPLGAKGVVLGSVEHPAYGLAYFIEWDDAPKLAVLTVARKVGAA